MVDKSEKNNSYLICLIPPKSLRKEFMRVAEHAPEGGWVQEQDSLHITLKAVDMPRKKTRGDLLKRLEAVDFPVFDIRMRDADTFNRAPSGKADRSKIAWLRPDGVSSNEIQELHNKIMTSLRNSGFPAGDVSMRPHMTILWYDFNKSAGEMRDFLKKCDEANFPTWHVDRFYLACKRPEEERKAANDNGKPVSRYEIIASFKLGKPQV